jgi:hypothetical protein
MKALMIDGQNKSTGIFDFEPSLNFKSVVPIAMADDETIQKLHNALNPSKYNITTSVIKTMKENMLLEKYADVKRDLQKYLGLDVCCASAMQTILDGL